MRAYFKVVNLKSFISGSPNSFPGKGLCKAYIKPAMIVLMAICKIESVQMPSKRQRNKTAKHNDVIAGYAGDDMITKESGARNMVSINVSWQRVKAIFYPFHPDGVEEGDMIESAVTGMVVDALLSGRGKSHTVSI